MGTFAPELKSPSAALLNMARATGESFHSWGWGAQATTKQRIRNKSSWQLPKGAAQSGALVFRGLKGLWGAPSIPQPPSALNIPKPNPSEAVGSPAEVLANGREG